MFKYSNTNKRYYTLDYYYKNRFGSKVCKINLDAKFTCPNIDGTKGYVRHIDYQRYKQLKQRYKKVMRKFLKHYDEIAQQWRDALDEMSSLEYWHAYLEKHDKQK